MLSGIAMAWFPVIRPGGWRNSTKPNGVVPVYLCTCTLYVYVSWCHNGPSRSDSLLRSVRGV